MQFVKDKSVQALDQKIHHMQKELENVMEEREKAVLAGQKSGHVKYLIIMNKLNVKIEPVEECLRNDSTYEDEEDEQYLEEEQTSETNDEEGHLCIVCQEQFPDDYTFHIHQKLHSEAAIFDCDDCTYRFNHQQDLNNHILFHFGKRSHLCSICGLSFKNLKSLSHHTETALNHSSLNRIKCDMCSRFVKDDCFEAHYFLYHGRKYSCSYCSREYISEIDLVPHLMTHYKKIKYTCELCQKVFPFAFMVEKHKAMTHKRSFICAFCKKAFTQKSHLTIHIRNHLNDRRFLCKICKLTFISSSALTMHQQKRHGRSKMIRKPDSQRPTSYKCRLCKVKVFDNIDALNAHRKEAHARLEENVFRGPQADQPTSLTCQFCGKSFPSKNTIRQHFMIHTGEKPYTCVYCGKSFVQCGHLTIHLRIHTGERPYQCDICGKGFISSGALQQHLYVHSETKRYMCELCDQSFMRKKILTHHMDSVHKNR